MSKHTVLAKSGQVPLELTVEDYLTVLRAKHGDNGRAILRELIDFIIELDDVRLSKLDKQTDKQGLDPILSS